MKWKRPLTISCAAMMLTVGMTVGLNAVLRAQVGVTEMPTGTLVEAETIPVGDNLKIDDGNASGGKAVSSAQEWEPLAYAPLPEAGSAFTVWVRHRFGPILLKSAKDGQQKDLHWIWDKPESYKWTQAGTFARGELGDAVLIIRGPKQDGPDALVDAVVLSPATLKTLPPFAPDGAAAPITVQAAVEWNQRIAPMRPMLWGFNDYEVLDPQTAADQTYQKLLADLRPSLIRIHHGDFSNRWTDGGKRAWDVEKIKAGLTASTGFKGARIMLNVSLWPSWLSSEATLTPEKEDEFARLCGDLVTTLRDLNYPVDYWEMTNEYDEAYEKAGKLDDLWRLFNKIVVEVRRADPNAKVGGPALRWPNPKWLEGFFINCGQNIDFVTWHNYASGDIYDANETIFDKAPHIARYTVAVREAAEKWAPNRKLEFYLSELNIKWVWTPVERRHGNNIGAIFQASTLRHIAVAGNGNRIDGVALWHAKGNSYGFIDKDNERRAPYYLYQWGTKYLSGDITAHKSDDEKSLELLPIVRADGTRSLLLIAKANRSVAIPNAAALLPPVAGQKLRGFRVDADGYKENIEMPATGKWTLPGYSLTLLTTAKG